MEIQKRAVIILTPDGEFIHCKRQPGSYAVGQEISFNKQDQITMHFSFSPLLKSATLLVACFLCVFLFLYNKSENKALAYVSIDINPSLEATVTKNLHVTELKAYNDDGKRILKELKNWKNESFQDVVRIIITQSKKDGYLTGNNPVILTSVIKSEGTKELRKQLQKNMQDLKSEYSRKHVMVVCQESTMEMREAAKKQGFSTGAYMKKEQEKKLPPVLKEVPTPSFEQPDVQEKKKDEEVNPSKPISPPVQKENPKQSVPSNHPAPKPQLEKNDDYPKDNNGKGNGGNHNSNENNGNRSNHNDYNGHNNNGHNNNVHNNIGHNGHRGDDGDNDDEQGNREHRGWKKE
jgi:hypothetical protein